MMFSKPPLPNVIEAQSIATALDAACMNLATVAASLPAERGAVLFADVQDSTLAVFKALVPVIISIRDKIDKGSESHTWCTLNERLLQLFPLFQSRREISHDRVPLGSMRAARNFAKG